MTAGHIHYGVKGKNGPVIVTLFKYETPMNEVSESGTITSENLKGPLAGKPLSELAIGGAKIGHYTSIYTLKKKTRSHCRIVSFYFLYKSKPFILGILISRINKSYEPATYLSSAKVGSFYGSTLKLFSLRINLNDSRVSGSSSTINIE